MAINTITYSDFNNGDTGLSIRSKLNELGSAIVNFNSTAKEQIEGNTARIDAIEASETALGWKDLFGNFNHGIKGTVKPVETTLPNGLFALKFPMDASVFIDYHFNHDGQEGTPVYPHIHMFSTVALTEGQTIIWTGEYLIARGYTQGDTFLSTRQIGTLTYTVPTGGLVAGEHIIAEGTVIGTDTFPMPEPDTIMQIEWKRTGGTFTGDLYAIQADLHYQSSVDTTVNRNYPFS